MSLFLQCIIFALGYIINFTSVLLMQIFTCIVFEAKKLFGEVLTCHVSTCTIYNLLKKRMLFCKGMGPIGSHT